MSDLISRQAVLDKFKSMCDVCGEGEKYNGVMCRACALDDGICIVEDMPSAEPERDKGEWKEHKMTSRDYGKIYYQHDCCCDLYESPYRYCPNCGMEMERGDR